MRVLIACEFSAIVRDAFAANGHDAWSCDLLPTEGDPKNHIQGDVLSVVDRDWDLMIAHPPCTHLTCSGNKWFLPEYKDRFPNKLKDREKSIEFVKHLMDAPIEKIAIENPIGVLSTRIRKPDQIIQPFQFGHRERKATCLWLKNLPPLAHTSIVEPIIKYTKSGKGMSLMYWVGGSMKKGEKWKYRSRTFSGIATAMADQWGGYYF